MKKADKMKLIPRDTLYCNRCPFLSYRKTDFGFKIKGEPKVKAEYCKYLKTYLICQDQVKDCGISCGEWD